MVLSDPQAVLHLATMGGRHGLQEKGTCNCNDKCRPTCITLWAENKTMFTVNSLCNQTYDTCMQASPEIDLEEKNLRT